MRRSSSARVRSVRGKRDFGVRRVGPLHHWLGRRATVRLAASLLSNLREGDCRVSRKAEPFASLLVKYSGHRVAPAHFH